MREKSLQVVRNSYASSSRSSAMQSGELFFRAVHQSADAAGRHFGGIEGREQIEQPLLLLDVRIEPGGEIALAQNDRHAIVIRLKHAVRPGRDDGARG